MQKLIVCGTVLALVLALELQAHTPPVRVDLPVPVPTYAVDGTLDGLAAISTFWREAPGRLSRLKDDGFSTYSVNFAGLDALLGLLDSEQIDCSNDRGRINRYTLWAGVEAAFVDLNTTGCEPCLTNPNEAGCENCLLGAAGYSEGGDLFGYPDGYLESGTLNARLYRAGGYHIDELENLVVRYRYLQYDNASMVVTGWLSMGNCAGYHRHKPGTGLHTDSLSHHTYLIESGDWSPWYLMSALRSVPTTVDADSSAAGDGIGSSILQRSWGAIKALLAAED